MKQEYHYTISRLDRIWLIVFVSLLLGWELIKYALPDHSSDILYTDNVAVPDASIAVIDPNDKFQQTKKYKRLKDDDSNRFNQYTPEENIAPFEISEATFQELRSAGLSSKVAGNILRYIAAGGKVKNINDLMKIYGMDSSQLKAASPYLIYPTVEKVGVDSMRKVYTSNRTVKIIDLNAATISQLDSLPGIGPVLAERITKYKDGLGGFFDVIQLQEVYGLPPETFEKIAPQLVITTPPSKFHINEIDLTNFTHPYLHKRFPKMIKAYMSQHGPFSAADALRKVYPPDSTWCDKILPYLIFD